MPLVSSDQIVRTGSVGALEKDVVIGVARYLKPVSGSDKAALVLYELKKPLPDALKNLKFRSRQHFAVFGKNRL
jgi:hypothetical protein